MSDLNVYLSRVYFAIVIVMHLLKKSQQNGTKPQTCQNRTKNPKPPQSLIKTNDPKQNPNLFFFFFICIIFPRESIYRLLPQTTPENVSKNFSHYSIDPATRYPNINVNFLRPQQVNPNWCCSVLVICSVFPQAKLCQCFGSREWWVCHMEAVKGRCISQEKTFVLEQIHF